MMEVLFDQARQDRIRDSVLLAQGEFSMLASLVDEKIVSKEYAAEKLGITVEEFEARRERAAHEG